MTFKQMRKEIKKFPRIKRKTLTQKQLESIPLEKEQSKRLGLKYLNRSADRMMYDQPINKQASKVFK